MKAAYGTFLAALLVEKCHDMVADQAASKFNVSWIRTAPIVVSAGDEAYNTYLTLECDHRMGMTVVGDSEKVKAFRFACSSAISPIEHWIMKSLFPDSYGDSVTVGLGQKILNGEPLDIFESGEFIVIEKIRGIEGVDSTRTISSRSSPILFL